MRQLLARNTIADGGRRREAGVAAALEAPPGSILMDIQLPKISGSTRRDSSAAMRGRRGVPIIVVTSFALSGDEHNAKAAGATAYLAKRTVPASCWPRSGDRPGSLMCKKGAACELSRPQFCP